MTPRKRQPAEKLEMVDSLSVNMLKHVIQGLENDAELLKGFRELVPPPKNMEAALAWFGLCRVEGHLTGMAECLKYHLPVLPS